MTEEQLKRRRYIDQRFPKVVLYAGTEKDQESPKRIKRRYAKYICPDCGARSTAGHEHGIFHKQHERLKALIDSNCVPFAEIARRFGITTERVRQIALQRVGIRGRDRGRTCKLAHREASWGRLIAEDATQTNSLFPEVHQECKKHGLCFELILTKESRKYKTVESQKAHVLINGIQCGVRMLGAYSVGSKRYNRIGTFRIPFMIGKSQIDGSWWVIPRSECKNGTTWSSDPIPKFGTKETNHSQRAWRDAWHLLANQETV